MNRISFLRDWSTIVWCQGQWIVEGPVWKQRAEKAEAEVERLNKMRVHCQRCGADYLATGVEAGCPCELRADVERLRALCADIKATCLNAYSDQSLSPGIRNFLLTIADAAKCGEKGS